MNANHTPTQGVTLEEINRRKNEIRKEINGQKEKMLHTTRRLLAPFAPQASGNTLMKSFNTGIAIFDGVMLGMKIIKNVKHFFGRRS